MPGTDGSAPSDADDGPAPSEGVPTVAVVGSYNTGFVVEMPRFPVPGETVTGSNFEEVVGGKGSNQAVGAARLGAETRFVGCVGEDRHAETALDLWEREGVDAAAVERVDDHTGVGVVFVDEDGENEIAVVPGANGHLDRDRVESAESSIADADVLLTQLEVSDDAVAAALEAADRHGVTTVLNPAPARELPREILERVDFLTPNESEARILAGLDPDAAIEDEDLAVRVRRSGADTVVLTQGSRGALFWDGVDRAQVPAPDVDPVDTTGAGDAFNAGFAVALAEGRSPVEAARVGCVAGALSVTEFDVIPSLPDRAALGEWIGGE